MNEDVFAGRWKEMRGTLRSWWGNLTDDDFEWIGGQKDRLVGLVQQKYGYTRDQAQSDVDRRFRDYNDTYTSAAKDASAKLYDIGQTVADKARDAGAVVSNGMERASSYLQEKEFRDMADDLVAVVRRYPIPFVLLALGVGYALARAAFGRERY